MVRNTFCSTRTVAKPHQGCSSIAIIVKSSISSIFPMRHPNPILQAWLPHFNTPTKISIAAAITPTLLSRRHRMSAIMSIATGSTGHLERRLTMSTTSSKRQRQATCPQRLEAGFSTSGPMATQASLLARPRTMPFSRSRRS